MVVVGSWHGTESTRTCESYDVTTDRWSLLPPLNDGTCAPGLIVIKNRYLYKLGGTSDIGKVELLDLEQPRQWVTINTCNKFGRKHTINRCLLFELPRACQDGDSGRKLACSFACVSKSAVEPQNWLEEEGKFLVLGCHFGRSEKPFMYDVGSNKYL